MFPSAPQNHHGGWSHHPAYDYWSKHSYTWHQGPHPEAAAGAGAGAGAGAAGAAEAAAGANANFAHARAPGMHYHYHGRGGFPGGYRRFGGGRRLVWFGLGIAATAWYYKHQEHQREWHAKAIADKPDSATKHFWTNGCDNTWSHGWRRSAHEHDSKEASAQTITPLPQPQVQMHAMPTTSTLPAPSSPTPNQVSDASRVLSALEQTPAFPTQIASPAEVSDEKTTSTDRRTWGWGERRRRRREASETQEREARAVVAASMEQPSINTRDGEAEMKRLREVVEALWNDRKLTAATAQAQANDQAKEYAREKLDRLSGVLESLRESLKTDAEKIMDKKLV